MRVHFWGIGQTVCSNMFITPIKDSNFSRLGSIMSCFRACYIKYAFIAHLNSTVVKSYENKMI